MANKAQRKLAAIDATREQVEVTVQVYVPRRMIDERVS